MKYHRSNIVSWTTALLLGASVFSVGGCASNQTPQQITEDQFVALYKDENNITDVWYMGSDDSNDYFCMEHWTLKPDGSDGKLDQQEFFKVALSDIHPRQPFPYTTDQNKWRLMRPKHT